MITFAQAEEAIDTGRHVTYRAYPGASIEVGVIVAARAGTGFVHVRYGSDATAKATPLSYLNWEHPDQPDSKENQE